MIIIGDLFIVVPLPLVIEMTAQNRTVHLEDLIVAHHHHQVLQSIIIQEES